MENRRYTGLDFIENFALFAGLLWVGGALLVGSLVLFGSPQAGTVAPASNVTPVAESQATQ